MPCCGCTWPRRPRWPAARSSAAGRWSRIRWAAGGRRPRARCRSPSSRTGASAAGSWPTGSSGDCPPSGSRPRRSAARRRPRGDGRDRRRRGLLARGSRLAAARRGSARAGEARAGASRAFGVPAHGAGARPGDGHAPRPADPGARRVPARRRASRCSPRPTCGPSCRRRPRWHRRSLPLPLRRPRPRPDRSGARRGPVRRLAPLRRSRSPRARPSWPRTRSPPASSWRGCWPARASTCAPWTPPPRCAPSWSAARWTAHLRGHRAARRDRRRLPGRAGRPARRPARPSSRWCVTPTTARAARRAGIERMLRKPFDERELEDAARPARPAGGGTR